MNEEVKYLIEKLQELNPEAVLIDDFDKCLIGFGKYFADGESRFCAVYDFEYIIAELKDKYELDRTEAIEYYDFNIANTGGGFYPIFLYRE
jgi:ribosomal protein S24E